MKMCQCQDNCCVILLELLGQIYQLYQKFIDCAPNPCSYPCFGEVLKPVKACVLDLLHCGEVFCCEGVAEAIRCAVETFLKTDGSDLESYQLVIFCICQTAKSTGKFTHNRCQTKCALTCPPKKKSKKSKKTRKHPPNDDPEKKT